MFEFWGIYLSLQYFFCMHDVGGIVKFFWCMIYPCITKCGCSHLRLYPQHHTVNFLSDFHWADLSLPHYLHIKRMSYSHSQHYQEPQAAHLHPAAHRLVSPAHRTGLSLYVNENRTQTIAFH